MNSSLNRWLETTAVNHLEDDSDLVAMQRAKKAVSAAKKLPKQTSLVTVRDRRRDSSGKPKVSRGENHHST